MAVLFPETKSYLNQESHEISSDALDIENQIN